MNVKSKLEELFGQDRFKNSPLFWVKDIEKDPTGADFISVMMDRAEIKLRLLEHGAPNIEFADPSVVFFTEKDANEYRIQELDREIVDMMQELDRLARMSREVKKGIQ